MPPHLTRYPGQLDIASVPTNTCYLRSTLSDGENAQDNVPRTSASP